MDPLWKHVLIIRGNQNPADSGILFYAFFAPQKVIQQQTGSMNRHEKICPISALGPYIEISTCSRMKEKYGNSAMARE